MRPEISRRGVILAALGAALIAVTVAGVVLISARPKPPGVASPSASGSPAPSPSEFDFVAAGWGWSLVDQPAPSLVGQVASGYLGECVAAGRPALCTSRDGVSWTLEVDASVFEMAGGGNFEGWSIARGSAGWVATGTVNPGTWHSTDGLTWTEVPTPGLDIPRAHVQALASGFAMVAEVSENRILVKHLFLSADGSTWTTAQLPENAYGPAPAGVIGLVATTYSTTGVAASQLIASADGMTWHLITVPDNVKGIGSTVRLPSGGYLGLATQGYFSRADTLLSSTDGLTWQVAEGPGPAVESLTQVGGRAVVVARLANSDLRAVFESTDGLTWQQIGLLDGNPLAGTAVTAVGDKVGLLDGSRLVAVGSRLGGQNAVSPSPSPARLETPAASPLVVGGWRWHPLGLMPDGPVVRLPNGYLGRCRDSMCTSANGWTWQVPADPAIFKAGSDAVFTPGQYVRSKKGDIVILTWDGVWYSHDGVTFNEASVPAGFDHLMGVALHGDGFAMVAVDSPTSRARRFLSPDGAEWTDAGLLNTALDVGFEGSLDTAAGLLGTGEKGRLCYSADGWRWSQASFPAGTLYAEDPYRLADGRLLTVTSEGVVVTSTDGQKWTRLATVPKEIERADAVVVGKRVIVAGNGVAWESTDNGASFHELTAGADVIEPFGDLLFVRSGIAYYVAEPLPESESAATTPTATSLPIVTAAPSPTPAPAPGGGISKEEAVRIATVAVGTDGTIPSADVTFDDRLGRWVWYLNFTWSYEGPLAAQGTDVSIDLFSGEILAMGDWIA